ncbi:1,4-alpha-glucan-branching enzyme [Trema orientale]|uniref:Aldehyde oxidase GLOX n=1 Tax=Trema orientale TaxID=63057 RepID=A0A2P5EPB9_TREOI|nr:1,4-alpha-glucan-branching enzyme [Trema orientale]
MRSTQPVLSHAFVSPIILVFSTLLLQVSLTDAAGGGGGGQWQLLQPSIGISAMHMQLLNNDRVVVFDRTDFGRSNLQLAAGVVCPKNSKDCTAHSAEYDVGGNTFRPLTVQTNVWCSSGVVTADGALIQTGGSFEGERTVRVFKPCNNNDSAECDWREINLGLAKKRWYSTNHILPDGRQIIIGGLTEFNYEFYPKDADNKVYDLPFLAETYDKAGVENNLYPFVFLNVDGNLFVFANNRAILLDYVRNQVVKTYPEIPGGDPRCYPSTGSAVLLPLKINIDARNVEAEVLVCGGAPKGSVNQAWRGEFVRALNTCARIKITDPKPEWVVETMPSARVMGDMILLPNGNVLLINGAGAGTAMWELGRNPVLNPVIYRPGNEVASRFELQNPTTIPRMYHSAAVLLRDGRVLVGGSNPHSGYNFTGVLYPTELSLEAFSPSYLDNPNLQPVIVMPASQTKLKLSYSQEFWVRFRLTGTELDPSSLSTTMVLPSFSTHSFSMNQRLLVLPMKGQVNSLGKSTYEVTVRAPGSANVAPSGYYLLFVVHQEIPSQGVWVHIS